MSTGRPLTIKCPSCMRGKWGHEQRQGGGIGRVVGVPQREEWRSTRRGGVLRTLSLVRCGDCKHEWWTTLAAKDRPEEVRDGGQR